MNTKNLLKSRIVLALLAGIMYLAWKLLAPYFGLDDSAGGLLTDAIGVGNGGLALVWALGHCDGLDGPVVTVARKALETGNIKLVLPWVRAEDEGEIRKVFDQARSVRKLGEEARELADTHFFETLVRIHRAGEGAPFSGLQPAGRDLGPAVPAADKALENGSIEQVEKLLTDAIRNGVHKHFDAALGRRKFDPNDVKAGRVYVDAYVPYVHYVERLWQAAQGATHAHGQHHAEPGH
ncbi:MAG: hypothetical protein A3E79_11870 [Burkholderiales bacterium RIFCSPHIGHO2_12_FULL_61_11]|nr:MAG: hypothetical protein A3E79_11870 [Burkholderiales bacterium RIFCSPHIGHO2_12_FULL_61_11]